MNRNFLIIVIIAVSLVVVVSVYYFVYLPSIPKVVNVVFLVPPEHGYWELVYAQDAGIYEEEGLNVTYTTVRTPVEMTQSLIAGEADFCVAVGEPLILSLQQGSSNLKCVLATTRAPFAFVSRPGITSFEEVQSFAAPGQADSGYHLMDEYLKRQDLVLGVDVTVSFVGWPGLLPAVLEGQVDATMLGTASSAAIAQGGKVLFSFAEEFPDFLMLGLTTTDDVISEQPELVKAMVKAIYRSQVYLMTHKSDAIDYAVNVLGLDQNYANFVYDWGYEGVTVKNIRADLPGLPVDALNYTMQFHAMVLGKEELPLDQWVDFSFLQQVEEELGIN
jgi:ABC-type nitrate/sulfonate/bicarbonate transport system substrate-binding protein